MTAVSLSTTRPFEISDSITITVNVISYVYLFVSRLFSKVGYSVIAFLICARKKWQRQKAVWHWCVCVCACVCVCETERVLYHTHHRRTGEGGGGEWKDRIILVLLS